MGYPNDQQDYDDQSLYTGSLCAKCGLRPRRMPYEFCSKECGRQCRIPDCTEQRFGKAPYCSQLHRKTAVQLGIAKPCSRCGIFPQDKNSFYCGKTCSSLSDAANDNPAPTSPPPPPHVTAKNPNPNPNPNPNTHSNPSNLSRMGPRPPIAGDNRIPRPPKPYIKPRSA
ncbi:hypothetical protein FRB90_003593, partial [Tulasnella sp. 427]